MASDEWTRVNPQGSAGSGNVSIRENGQASFLSDAAETYLEDAEEVEVLAKDGKLAFIPEAYTEEPTHTVNWNGGNAAISTIAAIRKAGIDPEDIPQSIRCEAEWGDDHETMIVVDLDPVREEVADGQR